MSEGRRGRRPPLPAKNVAQVTPIESTEGASSTASDVEQGPRALVEEEETEAPGKGVVYYMYLLITCINYNYECGLYALFFTLWVACIVPLRYFLRIPLHATTHVYLRDRYR